MLVPRALSVSVPRALRLVVSVQLRNPVGSFVSMQMRNSVPFQTVALGLSAKSTAGRPAMSEI